MIVWYLANSISLTRWNNVQAMTLVSFWIISRTFIRYKEKNLRKACGGTGIWSGTETNLSGPRTSGAGGVDGSVEFDDELSSISL